MKTNFLFSSLCLILLIQLQSCAPKLAEPLKKIRASEFAASWEKLETYPIDRGRSDDLHFFDPLTGFVINSQGYLSYTEDGGKNWEVILENEETFFRCITFKNRNVGWLGTIGTEDQYLSSRDTVALYETKDAGKNWTPVNFIGPNPKGLCGLYKVNDQMIVGTGRVRGPSFFIKTTDGGENWYSYDLNHLAGILIATYFFDEQHGLLIGGTATDKDNSRSMVLKTLNGGMTWGTVYLSEQKGEYPWKFSFPSEQKGFISIQRNVRDGRFYHLKTVDGGKNWKEVEHSPDYYYVQAIGFIDENRGWIGGSNTWTYETRDGGDSWSRLKNIGDGFNNFQFFGDSLAYGFGVFKNSNVQKVDQQNQKDYYSGSQLRGTFTIVNRKRNGLAQTFYPNGKLASKGTYKDNLKQGEWKYFNEEGKLLNTVKTKNGTARVSKKMRQSYIGQYESRNGVIRKITFEEGQMYAQRNNGRRIPIFPETKNRYFYGFNTDVTIEFIKDEKGRVAYCKIYQDGKYAIATKL